MNITQWNNKYLLIFLTLIGAFLHFYNLSWGAPYFFHPDERNVASSISQLELPGQLNPNFFAYGSLPIYTVFFTGVLINSLSPLTSHFSHQTVPFEQAIAIGRFYSAVFATALIPILYIITRKLIPKQPSAALLTAFFATASAGFIQFAHFGTFEMWLTFFTVLLFWVSFNVIQKRSFNHVVLIGLLSGILIATKISHLVILVIPFLALLISSVKQTKQHQGKIKRSFVFIGELFLIGLLVAFVYVVTNPFVFLDFNAFYSSMQYESSVGLNTLPVFYTQGFYDTVPVLYQFLHVYPFLLNPLMTLLFIPSLFFVLWQTWKTKSPYLLILISCFLILFLSQAVLFIKWTRYMTPTLPFVFMIIAFAFTNILSNKKNSYSLFAILCILFINAIISLSYFITAFVQPDTRITAAAYAKQRIPENAPILTETYDIGITAFNPYFTNVTLFNTYDLDANSYEYSPQTWKEALETADYVILPSQRVIQTRLQNPNRFPNGNKAYTSLLDGSAGFEMIYQTPCDIFCKITYLDNPHFFEQTANVFDRPTIYIFKKITPQI